VGKDGGNTDSDGDIDIDIEEQGVGGRKRTT